MVVEVSDNSAINFSQYEIIIRLKPTYAAQDSSSDSPSSRSTSSRGVGGLTRHIRTWPSLLPVAIKWYDRPQEGAQATEVTEYGVGESPSD